MVERAAVKRLGEKKVGLSDWFSWQPDPKKIEPKWGTGLMMKVWAPRGGLDRISCVSSAGDSGGR